MKVINEIIKLATSGEPETDYTPKLKEILGLSAGTGEHDNDATVVQIDDIVDTLGRLLLEARLGIAQIYVDTSALAGIIKSLLNLRYSITKQV